MKTNFKYLKTDLMAGMVVFLVALPLCLGIAVASGAPPFAGIICGVIAGIVVGTLSGSNVSVSGPAAGLIAIVLVAINDLGYESFLVAVMIAGFIQLIIGIAKAGAVSSYFPSCVIEGMLAAIGIIIIMKEIPHALGYDPAIVSQAVMNNQGMATNQTAAGGKADAGWLSSVAEVINASHTGTVIVSLISIAILIAFSKVPVLKKIKTIPGALIVVVAGIIINELFRASGSALTIPREQLVTLPVASSFSEFFGQFTTPDFSAITNPGVWIVGATLAVVASVETLLCLEAGDKMDPLKRFSSANQEMRAQGIGNMLSGLVGGLPMTSVIVRTSANINAGARTRMSAIAHGFFLLTAVVAIPVILNKIPMASLAAILIMIGIKLASPKVFVHTWKTGKHQFIPFIVTVGAVVLTDLLKGVGIGLVVAVFFILRGNMKLAYYFKKDKHNEGEIIHIDLAQEVSFLNKAAIRQTLTHLPENSRVVIDAANTVYIDHDVLEMIRDFVSYGSKDKNIKVRLCNFKKAYRMEDLELVHSVPVARPLEHGQIHAATQKSVDNYPIMSEKN